MATLFPIWGIISQKINGRLSSTGLLFYKWDTNSCASAIVLHSWYGNHAHIPVSQDCLHLCIPPAHYDIIQAKRRKPIPPHTRVKLVTLTWQIQQGSPSSGDPTAICFRCLRRFNIVSSLNPVLTFPMRSSSANNSYNSNYILYYNKD